MELGQRIAQKRKELGLSQEALGERLGVSRQAIYKWESSAAVPEIDKLVALSKLFGVSVGWLLGVEEDAAPPENSGELTEVQLRMVEEIVDRYIAALPKPKSRRQWLWAVPAVILLLFDLFKLYDLRLQNDSIEHNISQVERSVDAQINSISDRVEELLKAQNDLTADYGTEVKSINLEGNSITFSAYAVPKTYIEGMTAEFSVNNGNGANIKPAGPIHQTFSTDITCELTDSITLSVVFISPDGSRQTQLLDTYSGLYSKTLPYSYVDIEDNLSRSALTEPFLYTIPAPDKTPVEYVMLAPVQQGTTAIEEFRVGFFKNRELVAWAEPCAKPDHFLGYDNYSICCVLPDLQVRLTAGDELCFAAVVTDEYGRESIYPGFPCILSESGTELIWPDGWRRYNDTAANWTY